MIKIFHPASRELGKPRTASSPRCRRASPSATALPVAAHCHLHSTRLRATRPRRFRQPRPRPSARPSHCCSAVSFSAAISLMAISPPPRPATQRRHPTQGSCPATQQFSHCRTSGHRAPPTPFLPSPRGNVLTRKQETRSLASRQTA